MPASRPPRSLAYHLVKPAGLPSPYGLWGLCDPSMPSGPSLQV